ncbi:squalene/phytoene synthase family protein [Rhodospira trueperi]|uniref:Phytoene synthase n=1 Tax=Rhodospira trueperi TaxID=69960 RepID=A0A1G7DZX1_9PROT|nr:squalene/phytoene synthase family protein [Rhodospira trueperi]SDE56941.1 phytoene synthase [Rhodospira trueperi]
MLSPAAEQVRRQDHARFILALLAPPPAQPALFALFACHVELARVPIVASEPMAGAFRLQYWRDLVSAGNPAAAARGNPVAEAVAAHVLPALNVRGETLLVDLVDACADDLAPDPPGDAEGVRRLAERTSGMLSELAVRLLGVEDAASREMARHAGTAWGLVAMARATPGLIAAGRPRLPEQTLLNAGITPAAVLAGEDRDRRGIRAGVEAMAAVAEEDLASARNRATVSDPRARPMARQIILARHGLRTLRRAGYDPFDSRVAMMRPPLVRLVIDRLIRRA